jgi:uncharacterized lipoprotein YehR (DUF1307 family)
MKRIVLALLAVMMVLSLVACGGATTTDEKTSPSAGEETSVMTYAE